MITYTREVARLVALVIVIAAAGTGIAYAQGSASLKRLGPTPAHSVWLDTLDLSVAQQGWGNGANGARKSIGGGPITIGGTVYPHGFGTHATSRLAVDLHKAATQFTAVVGVDDDTHGKGSVIFFVSVDGKKVAKTGVMRGGDAPQTLSVNLTGAREMVLGVDSAIDDISYDHADWADALITLTDHPSAQPSAYSLTATPPSVLASQPRLTVPTFDPKPALHGASVVGATPGRPFLYLIAATGRRPLRYYASGLPAGLSLDSQTGIISGSLRRSGRSLVQVSVRGPQGSASRTLTIVGGANKLMLTPMMGWNSWYSWGTEVTAERVKEAADELVSTGLSGHGYGFVNIDDGWEAGRDAGGAIQPNSKFPDMKSLGDYIHSKGFRFGIYSSPGPKTCGNFTGSYGHVDQDVASYSSWGVDLLKYDWCSYDKIVNGDHSLPVLEAPYVAVHSALARSDRDIALSLCQYGMGDVWKWGANPSIDGQLWRTYTDITDVWTGSNSWGSDRGIYNVLEAQAGLAKYAGPGHWNDPDCLLLGLIGFGNPKPTHLAPNEQITYMSMWCMLSAPLLIGCDLTRLDPFTKALLTNDEALDIDQDPLGKAANQIVKADDTEIWARPLADGAKAVALINANPTPTSITVRWSELGVSGTQSVRDLWLHENVGRYSGGYSVVVPGHGCVLLKVRRA